MKSPAIPILLLATLPTLSPAFGETALEAAQRNFYDSSAAASRATERSTIATTRATTESTLQSMGAPYPPSQITREPKLTAEEKAEVQAQRDVWETTCKPRDYTDAMGNTRVLYAKPGCGFRAYR
jgi:hypothetical protein